MQFPFELSLQPSRFVMASVLVGHVSAALALFHVPAFGVAVWSGEVSLPHTLAIAFAWGLVGSSLVRALRAERRKAGFRLWLEDDGLVEIFSKGAEPGVLCRVRPHSAVTLDWAVWLRLTAVEPVSTVSGGSGRLPSGLMLVPSNMQQHDWRRLRTWLRHRADRPGLASDSLV